MKVAVVAGMAAGLAGVAVPFPAGAVDLHKSRFTSIELKACRPIGRHRDGGAWMCPGLRGYPVYVAEGDLRQFLAFGPVPQKRQSARQTLGPFNTIFGAGKRAAIEWRVERHPNGQDRPFATIVRYQISGDGEQSEVLVITKVDASQSCQLATIDTRANPEAMATARAWAIAQAKTRSCPEAPERLGAKGKLDP